MKNHIKNFFQYINESESWDPRLMSEIMRMDSEFDRDPVYKEYEEIYTRFTIKNMLSKQMGIDEVPEKMIDMFLGLAKASNEKKEKDPLLFIEHKESLINTVDAIIELANRDEEYELSGRLQKYRDLITQI